MHSPVILLVRVDSAEAAIEDVKDFLEHYKGTVWGWYQFGGRFAATFGVNELGLETDFAKPLREVLALVNRAAIEPKRVAKRLLKQVLKPKSLLEVIVPSKKIARIAGSYELGRVLRDVSDLATQSFSLGKLYNCNVYNCYMYDFSVPNTDETIDAYYAVLLDIHK